MITIPLLKVKGIVDSLIEYAKEDLETCIAESRETECFLYLVLNGNSSEGYDFYKEAKNIFGRTQEHRNKITTGLAYPKNMVNTPYIWVREPQRGIGKTNTIGKLSGDFSSFSGGMERQHYRDSKASSYEVVVMSQNYLESIMLSDVLYNLLMASFELFTTLFNFFEVNMKELMMNNDQLPPFMLLSRALTLDIDFDVHIPTISVEKVLNKVIFNGIIKAE